MFGKQAKLLVPVVVGATVVVLSGVAAYLYSDGYFGGVDTPLESAKLVPDEAVIAGVISAEPKAWSQLQQFGTPEAQKLVEKSFQDFQKEAFTESNIDYEKDVKPWLGSVMLAVLPPTPSTTQEPKVLMVVAIKNKASLLKFGNKLKSDKKTGETKNIDYKGTKISEEISKGKKSYTVVLKNHLVVTDELPTIQLAIDAFKGSPSLASKAGSADIFSRRVDVKNPIARLYVPDYPALMQSLLASNPSTGMVSPQTLKQFQQVKSGVMAVGIDEAGIRMKAVTQLNSTALQVSYQPSPGKVVSQFPADTIAVISGDGISRTWSAVVAQSKAEPELQKGLDEARKSLKAVNFDLDKDIFGWMDGEFAIGAIPSNQGVLAPVGFGGAMVIKTSDRKTAEATLGKLDTLAKGNAINVSRKNIQGKSVTEWQIPQQGTWLGYGWQDQDSLFVAIGGPIINIIVNKPSQTLDSSLSFKAVTGSLQKPNAGYFYLDMDKTMSLVNKSIPPTQKSAVIPPETSAVLESIQGFAMTATQPNSSTSQLEMLLALKPRTAK